ncbi:hypothetical protein PR048_033627 [Dryococelus australis]|uniref:Uncharacterized protein n=1 Tax=Dryococelus australis TaxID=614101 RepID=A0ABQ9G1P9_9NEOP|nr:hypothetical protein PR048_033627 [Dryococelus australis]
MVAKRGEYGVALECEGEGKREIPEKTRRPATSSGTIPTREKTPRTQFGLGGGRLMTSPGSRWNNPVHVGPPAAALRYGTASNPQTNGTLLCSLNVRDSLRPTFQLWSIHTEYLNFLNQTFEKITPCKTFFSSSLNEPTVAERLGCSPLTKANRVESPAGSLPDFRKWESCRTIPLVGEFSRGSPTSPPFHSGTAPFSLRLAFLKTSMLRAAQSPPPPLQSSVHSTSNPGKQESPLPARESGHVALCDADMRAMQSGGRRLSPCDAGRGEYGAASERGKREITKKTIPTSVIVRYDSHMRKSGSGPDCEHQSSETSTKNALDYRPRFSQLDSGERDRRRARREGRGERSEQREENLRLRASEQ